MIDCLSCILGGRAVMNNKGEKKSCLDIETIACYVDDKLSETMKKAIGDHLSICKDCKENIELQIAVSSLQRKQGLIPAPSCLTERAKNLLDEKFKANILEVIIKFTDKAIEIVRTTGEVFLGGHLQPAFVLRGVKETEATSTQTIFKVFDNVNVEIEVARQQKDLNRVILKLKDQQKNTMVNDLRVTLVLNDVELESYIAQNGKVIFENVKPGKYFIRISSIDSPIGIIMLDLNKE